MIPLVAFAVVIVIAIIFIAAAENFSNILNALTLHGTSKIILFSSKNCHVCRDLRATIWPKLQQNMPDITFELVDCVDDPTACSRYNIYAVPTIMMVKNGVPIVYRGAWRFEDIYSYIRSN
jgi:thioredoxin-like negative regulator of GroEL